MNQRLMVYRKVAASRTEDELDAGPGGDSRPVRPSAPVGAPPRRVRPHSRAADRLGVETIDREGQSVVIRFRPQAPVDPMRLVNVVSRVARRDAGAACVAEARPGRAAADTAGDRGRSAAASRADGRLQARAQTGQPVGLQSRRRLGRRRQLVDGPGDHRRGHAGFTREEILRSGRRPILEAGRVFDRVEALLRALG